MKEQSRKSLEGLSLFCHICGLITIVLGILVIFIDVVNNDFRHIQVGIFICASGYAFVKISSRIAVVLYRDRFPATLFSGEEEEN